MRSHDRVFRALMRLLPAEFRGDYEREMAATFRAERRRASGSLGVARLWMATAADVCRTAPAEHVDILQRDLSYAARMLARRPALTCTAVLTLALGIGANTAIFSVVNGVLFAPLPYPHADRLVLIQEHRANDQPGTTGYLSFDALRSQNQTFDSMSAYAGWSATLAGDGREAERIVGARVSWEFFRTLEVSPVIGRDFEQGEDHPEGRRVAIISHALWSRRFGGDRSIVGKPITINQVAYTLAGVMPAGLDELVTSTAFPDAEIWTLLGYHEAYPPACRTCRHIWVVGRMKPGVTPAGAAADLTRVYQAQATQFPREYDRPRAAVTTLRDRFLGPVQTPLYLLWGAAGLLLLIACANIANLLLIRASERDEEITIRRALGVSPPRLMRQLLTEAVVLACLGGVAGAALAVWTTSLLVAAAPEEMPRIGDVAVNGRVLLYALAISVATGVLFGMTPARVLLGRDLRNAAAAGSRRTTAGGWRYRATLVAANVAMSVLLLVGSGLLVRSFVRLLSVDPGFTPGGVLTMSIPLIGDAYSENAGIEAFYDELTARIRRLPGVMAVSASTQLPLAGSRDRSGITIEGRVYENPAAAPSADRYVVRVDYFRTMGIPLLRGRVFTDADGLGAPPVALVSQTMADELWPGRDPIGQRIRVAGGANNPFRTIVGVVGDVKHYGLHMPATLQVYVAHAQTHYPEPFTNLIVRVENGRDPLSVAGGVREQVRAMDPLQPVARLSPYDALIAESIAARRFTLLLLALFAATALVLAIVGLYGALSYVVTQRQRELGVRLALGAGRREIRALIVRQGMTPALLGVGAGVVLSVAGGRVVESMLYGTSPYDGLTLAVVLLVMMLSALTACLIPARRAAAVDPAIALRAE